MTAIVRHLIDAHIRDVGQPPTDLRAVAGTLHWGSQVNIERDKDGMLDEAFADLRRH